MLRIHHKSCVPTELFNRLVANGMTLVPWPPFVPGFPIVMNATHVTNHGTGCGDSAAMATHGSQQLTENTSATLSATFQTFVSEMCSVGLVVNYARSRHTGWTSDVSESEFNTGTKGPAGLSTQMNAS